MYSSIKCIPECCLVKSPPNFLINNFGNFTWHTWCLVVLSRELSCFLKGNSSAVAVLVRSRVSSASWTSRSNSSSGVRSRILSSSGEITSSLLFNDSFNCLSLDVCWSANFLRISSTCEVSRETDAHWAPLTFLSLNSSLFDIAGHAIDALLLVTRLCEKLYKVQVQRTGLLSVYWNKPPYNNYSASGWITSEWNTTTTVKARDFSIQSDFQLDSLEMPTVRLERPCKLSSLSRSGHLALTQPIRNDTRHATYTLFQSMKLFEHSRELHTQQLLYDIKVP